MPLRVVKSGFTTLKNIVTSEFNTAKACMDGKDELHRVYAVRAMAQMERREAQRALRAALNDPSTMVRRQAALLLAELRERDRQELAEEEAAAL